MQKAEERLCAIECIQEAKSTNACFQYYPDNSSLTSPRKAELEDELEKLRHQVELQEENQTSGSGVLPPNTSLPAMSLGMSVPVEQTSQATWTAPAYGASFPPVGPRIADMTSATNLNKSSSWSSPQNMNAFVSPSVTQLTDSVSLPRQSPSTWRTSVPTTPRTLGDLDLSPNKIKDCFALYEGIAVSHDSR